MTESRATIREPLWQGSIPQWTPRSARAAYSLAMSGDLSLAAQLCDAVKSDARVRGTLETRKNALFGCPLEFEGAGHKGRGGPIGRALKEGGEFWKMAPEPALAQIFTWGLLLNCGIGELTWHYEDELSEEEDGAIVTRDKRWILRLNPKHPRNLRFDQLSQKWLLMTADAAEVEVTPGDGRWIMFSPFGDNSPWMHGLYWPLALLWLSKSFSDFDWGRRNEARGRSALVGETPEGATQTDRDKFAESIAELRTKLGIALPPGYKLSAVEFGVPDHETFKTRIDWVDGSIGTLVLGQNLTAEPRAQSLAAPKTNDKVRQDYLENDAEAFATCLRTQMLRPYAAVRFGSAEIAPWPMWQTDPPEDLERKSQTIERASKALSLLLSRGVPVDHALFCETFDIPLIAGAPIVPPAPPAVPGEGDEEEEDEEDDNGKEKDPEK